MQTPALIIHDKEDNDTSYQNSVKLDTNWKDSKLMFTQGLWHSLKSKKMLEDIVQFIL